MPTGRLARGARRALHLRHVAARWILTHPTGRWVILGAGVGLLCGIAAAVFQVGTDLVAQFLLGQVAALPPIVTADHAADATLVGTVSPLVLLAVLGGGGLVAGLIIFRWSTAARGGGTGVAVHAFHHDRGVIPLATPWTKLAASIVSLGSGASGGREGPISLIGAGFGSWFAGRLRLNARDRRVLLAAGIAGGIAAVFRAPLAAAIFAAEVLYRGPELEADVLIPGFISAAIGYLVGTMGVDVLGPLVGHQGAAASTIFQPPTVAFHAGDWMQLVGYTVVAVASAVVSMWFIAVHQQSVRRFDAIPLPFWVKPSIGAIGTGLVALGIFLAAGLMLGSRDEVRLTLGTLGSGYGVLHWLFAGGGVGEHHLLIAGILATVALGKSVTTALTVGSGGSGGLFGPSIVIGGCTGGAVGFALAGLAIAPPPAACVLIGMAAVLAATHSTPVAALLMVSEIAGTWLLLLPAMWACGIAFLLSGKRSLISGQVDGVQDSPAHHNHLFADVLARSTVGELLTSDAKPITFLVGEGVEAIRMRIQETNQDLFPVLDPEGRLEGIFDRLDIARIVPDSLPNGLVLAADLIDGASTALNPTDTLATAMRKMHQQRVEALPVVDRTGMFIGIIRSGMLMEYYHQAVEHTRAERQVEGFTLMC